MALDVPGSSALVARGEKACCKRVVCGLAHVSVDGAHLASAAAPSPTRPLPAPPDHAPTYSVAPSRWGVVSVLEVGGGRGGGVAPPFQPACGGEAVQLSPVPTKVVGGALPRGGRCGLVPCGQGLVRVLPAQSALVLEFLQNQCLENVRRGCVRGAHSVHELVRKAMTKLCPMTRSVTTSGSPSSFEDFDARRLHWFSVVWTSRPMAISTGSGIWAHCSSCSARVTSLPYLV